MDSVAETPPKVNTPTVKTFRPSFSSRLLALAELHTGQIVTYPVLARHLWGEHIFKTTDWQNMLRQHIKAARRLLVDRDTPAKLLTVSRVGVIYQPDEVSHAE